MEPSQERRLEESPTESVAVYHSVVGCCAALLAVHSFFVVLSFSRVA
jgi:hypothetical protein